MLFISFENAIQRETDVSYMKEFAVNYDKLETFLNELSLVGSSILTDLESDQHDDEETLTLTTIHQAKGLEWDVVIVIGHDRRVIPSST